MGSLRPWMCRWGDYDQRFSPKRARHKARTRIPPLHSRNIDFTLLEFAGDVRIWSEYHIEGKATLIGIAEFFQIRLKQISSYV